MNRASMEVPPLSSLRADKAELPKKSLHWCWRLVNTGFEVCDHFMRGQTEKAQMRKVLERSLLIHVVMIRVPTENTNNTTQTWEIIAHSHSLS